ncbi:MAG TPA: ice-binding family protein [Candidatus Dormibacteraeota bacterium]
MLKGSRIAALLICIVGFIGVTWPAGALASTPPPLGTSGNFAVLAGTPTVSNTGPTIVSGSLGIFPAASVTGFNPPGTVINGTIEAGTPVAAAAKDDLTAAYLAAAASPCDFDESNQNLGGQTLTAGTYCQTTAPTLTGTLTLSGNGVFIFKAGSTLVTAPGASVVLTNGAQPCNVFWQVSSSATLDTTTTFVGTILALTDISLNDGATIAGRALARNGQVTLINNQITRPTTCNAATVAGPSPTPSTSPTPTPTPTPTPSASPVQLPRAGGPPRQPGFPWWPVAIIGGLAAVPLGLRMRPRR